MKYLVLDFETKDPYIGLGLGAGWVYALHNPNSLFRVIGFSTCSIDNHDPAIKEPLGDPSAPYYSTVNEVPLLNRALQEHDAVVFHNAQYDLGCLLSLGINIDNLVVYDTKIIAHLYDNRLQSYSLDYLAKLYLPAEQQKKAESLEDAAIKLGLVKHLLPKREEYNERLFRMKVKKWCYENMDVIQEADFKTMAYYANQDAIVTANLFKFFTGG